MALADRPRRGRPAKLSGVARTRLTTVLDELLATYGYATATWAGLWLIYRKPLAHEGWEVTVTTVARTLHQLGYGYTRPKHDLQHRQDADSVATPQQTLRILSQKRGVDGSGIRLVYGDECHRHTHPHLANYWQRCGARTMILATGVDQLSTFFGAIDYGSGELVWHQADKASSPEFFGFVHVIAATWPNETIVLMLDNASSHKSAALRHWIERQHERLILFYLPTNGPQLSLIERLWRWLKSELACHRLWNNRDGLVALVDHILDHTVVPFPTEFYPHLKMRQDL